MRNLFWAILFVSLGACQTTVTEECDCIVPITLSGRWYFVGYAKADGISEKDTINKHPYNTFIDFDAVSKKVEGIITENTFKANYNFLVRENDFRGNDLSFEDLIKTTLAIDTDKTAFEEKFVTQLSKTTNFDVKDSGHLLLYQKFPNPVEVMVFKVFPNK